MKKILSITIICFLAALKVCAQDGRLYLPTESEQDRIDSIKKITGSAKVDTFQIRLKSAYAWKLDPRYLIRMAAERDTARVNFHRSTLVEGKGVAMSYLGNVGSAAESKIFFDRIDHSKFIFQDAYALWRKMPSDQLFLNTKIPYSNLQYQSGGGAQNKEERFQAEYSMNFGKKVNFGFDFDYVYSRGFYQNLHNKQVNYDFYGSYIGDNYKMHAVFSNNNFNMVENGGITDPLYITNKNDDRLKATNFNGKSMDIPVLFRGNFWNRLRGKNLFVANRYDLGDPFEEVMGTDSVMRWKRKEKFISPASLIFTTHYSDQRRRVKTDTQEMEEIAWYRPFMDDGTGRDYSVGYKYNDMMNDYMSYWSWKNTFAISMNEGFRPWMKFGLSAFIELDMRKYLSPSFKSRFDEKTSQKSLWVGGEISSQQGKYLKLRGTAAIDVMKDNEIKIDGDLKTMFSVKNKPFEVRVNAYYKSIAPSFFENRFSSRYWNWDLNLSKISRLFVGGEIESKATETKISGGFENIKNYIYYGADGVIDQSSSNVQVMSIRLDQNFRFGKFNWENQVVFQKSTKEEIIPLPKLTARSNMYLQTHIAKVLTLQLGAEVTYHTKYYAPGYEPLTMQFYNQRDRKIGNFPLTNVYINLHLKYTRFFVMMYNVTEGMGKSGHFSTYNYAVNPRMLKLGLSWSFNN